MRTPQERLEAWNRVAKGWERRRDLVWRQSSHVSEWLLDHADVKPGRRVLELAAGTGDTAALIAERVGGAGRVIATDLSPEMVEVMRRSLGPRANVETRALDAQRMDLPGATVDAVVCRFGFNLMLQPAAAAAESRRVLVRGGPLAVAVWGRAEDNPWITAITGAIGAAGIVDLDDPTSPGGMFSLADPGSLRSMLEDAGFGVVELDVLEHPWRYASFSEMWDTQTDLSGALSAIVPVLDGAAVDRLRADVASRLAPYRSGEGYDIPGSVVCAVAR